MAQTDAAVAILAVSAVVGGGVLSYTAARAAGAEGGLFGVDRPTDEPMTIGEGAATGAAMLTGMYLTYEALKEAADDVGLEPLVLGGLGVAGITAIIWLRKR